MNYVPVSEESCYFFFPLKQFFFKYESFVCIRVCVSHACMVSEESRREHLIA